MAIRVTKIAGRCLEEASPRGVDAVMERTRGLLHEGGMEKSVQFELEDLFGARERGFEDAVGEELDLVEEDKQITFDMGLDNEFPDATRLDVFRAEEPDYGENARAWVEIKRERCWGRTRATRRDPPRVPPPLRRRKRNRQRRNRQRWRTCRRRS